MGAVDKSEKGFCSSCCSELYDRLFGWQCCKCLIPHKCCGFCVFFTILLVALVALHATVLDWNPAFSAIVGPYFASERQADIIKAFQTGDFSKVQDSYQWRLWLGESVLILGNAAQGIAFIDRRGLELEESISIRYDKRLPIASGSKFFGAVTIYAVIEHPLTSLSLTSTPGDYFPFWNCSEPEDPNEFKCNNITVEKLLAFRHGLGPGFCERALEGGPTWDECVKRIYNRNTPYNPSAFDFFEYGPVGLTIAGLMALKEMQKLPGFENATWDDVKQALILDPSNITDAPKFDTDFYTDGEMKYDFDFGPMIGDTGYDGSFPDLSASLGASPEQYAKFMTAFIQEKLVSAASIEEITRSHGGVGQWFGYIFEDFSEYAQGMWNNGVQGYSHSVGFFGFFPWIDRSDPDPANHFFGIIATNNRKYFPWAMDILLYALIGPLIILVVFSFATCMYSYSGRGDTEDESVLEAKS